MKEDVKELILARLDGLPSNIKISIGGIGTLTKSEIIDNVEKETEIGERVAEIQIAYIQSLVRR